MVCKKDFEKKIVPKKLATTWLPLGSLKGIGGEGRPKKKRLVALVSKI